MAPLAGTYEFVSQNNYVEYLQSLGLSAAQAKKSEGKDKLVIGPVESDKVTVAFSDNTIVFSLNKEEKYAIHEGFTTKATATLNGQILTLKINISEDGSFAETKIFTPSDSGLVVTSSNTKGVKGDRTYKRV